MAINPVTDIVFDVARAAGPAKSRLAVEKLSPDEASGCALNTGFGQMLTDTFLHLKNVTSGFVGHTTKSADHLPEADARTKAYKGLEQLVLKNLIESMLPKESGAFFGGGTEGSIWRSFLADQLAAQVGQTVDLGIMPQAAPHKSTASQSSVPNKSEIVPKIPTPFKQS